MNTPFADKIEMQHRLFSELSHMFGKEVPLYDKSLLVNRVCNKTVCSLLSEKFSGFEMSDAELDKTSGERHGAIRIGRADEFEAAVARPLAAARSAVADRARCNGCIYKISPGRFRHRGGRSSRRHLE